MASAVAVPGTRVTSAGEIPGIPGRNSSTDFKVVLSMSRLHTGAKPKARYKSAAQCAHSWVVWSAFDWNAILFIIFSLGEVWFSCDETTDASSCCYILLGCRQKIVASGGASVSECEQWLYTENQFQPVFRCPTGYSTPKSPTERERPSSSHRVRRIGALTVEICGTPLQRYFKRVNLCFNSGIVK